MLQKYLQHCPKMVPKGFLEPSWRHLGPRLPSCALTLASRKPLGALWGAFWTALANSWSSLEILWSALGPLWGPSWTLQGTFWELLNTSWQRLERSWSHLGELLDKAWLLLYFSMVVEVSRGAPERLEMLLEACLALLELSWELLRPLGGVLKPLGSLLGSSWSHLGASWRLY